MLRTIRLNTLLLEFFLFLLVYLGNPVFFIIFLYASYNNMIFYYLLNQQVIFIEFSDFHTKFMMKLFYMSFYLNIRCFNKNIYIAIFCRESFCIASKQYYQ